MIQKNVIEYIVCVYNNSLSRRQMGCGAVNPNNIDSPLQTILTLNKIYERKELIGSGTYGKVYRCINKLNNQEYALKVVEITAKNKEEAIKQINSLKTEIGVLKKLNHQNIVKYYSFDISQDNKNVEIVLQYAKQGSLKEYIQKRGSLSQADASSKTAQILQGLRYLHDQNIVHRDLKCANILIMEDGTLKISDFGTAKHIKITSNQDISKLCSSLKGTPYYMAPQVLRRTGHNILADIWSLGCLVIEMISGKAPWTSLTSNFEQIISYIVSGIHPPFPKDISQECQCFLQSCVDNVPSQRLSALELLRHRWIDHTSIQKMNADSKDRSRYTIKTKADDIYQQLEDQKWQSNLKIDKRILKEQKYKQIDNYLDDRSKNTGKKKIITQRTSAKAKKDKSASIKHTEESVCQQIEVVPHYQYESVNKCLFGQNEKVASVGKKQESFLKITKTAPQIRLSQNIIPQLKEIQQQFIEIQTIGTNDMNGKSEQKTKVGQEITPKDIINSFISRQERNRYLQQQKLLKSQREEQRLKWQRELQEGANYLRKQMNNRYIF